MNGKSGVVAFFLSIIPGLGHLYLNRYVRAGIYGLGSLVIICCGVFLSLMANDDKFVKAGLFLVFAIWMINGIDMVITLIARSQKPMAVHTIDSDAAMNGDESYHLSKGGSDERFHTILLSLIPGLGHFQLGLMNRGLTFLIGFFGMGAMIVFVTAITGVEGFLAFLGVLPVIWLYSLFDAVGLLHRKQKGEVLEDRTPLDDLDRQRETGHKNKMVATLLSMFPGAGHMYLGLQRRGLQLMAFFLFSIYILDMLRLSFFLFLIPIIWFFSFFDALQQVSRYQEGKEPLQDVPFVDRLLNHQKWIGIGLVLLGGFYLLDHMFVEVFRGLVDEYTYYFIQRNFQTTVVALLLILGGVKLLRGSKKNSKEVQSK